jgi:NAD+ kinase
MKLSKVALISKEGHGEAKEVASDIAQMLIDLGLSVISFPNIRLRGVDHVSSVKDLAGNKIDLIVTVSGDGTILRMLRTLDNSTPCLCVNVGGRGILAEIKPDQAKIAFEKILKGNIVLERRSRIGSRFKEKDLPPALNEVHLLRKTVAHTPSLTVDFDSGAVFTQRMDGVLISTPTGSTGHSYSYGGPFLEGSLDIFMLTPEGSISRFPTVVKGSDTPIRVLGNYALDLIIDGQEVFTIESDTFVTFKKHRRDAVFVRFDNAGSFRQLKNLGFT